MGFVLGKIFSEYVENVICIHPYVKIWDSTATNFTRNFYKALQDYTNPSTPFRRSVLRSFMEAKQLIAKQCGNDNACISHSHTPFCRHSEFKEDDNKTLIISNIGSIHELNHIKSLIEDEEQEQCILDDSRFQKDAHYEELSVAFLEFRNAKHRRNAIKILSQKQYDEQLTISKNLLLSNKNAEDEDEKKEDDHKTMDEEEDDNKNKLGLGWIHRILPRCCCSCHHPHLAQDKLLYLQDGHILNRSIIYDLTQIKVGLKEMRERQLRRMQNKEKRIMQKMVESSLEGTESASRSDGYDDIGPSEADFNAMSEIKEINPEEIKEIKEEIKEIKEINHDKPNDFGFGAAINKKNKFQNNFGTKPQPKRPKKKTFNFGSNDHKNFNKNKNFGGNNFGGNRRKKNNFDAPKRTKTNSYNIEKKIEGKKQEIIKHKNDFGGNNHFVLGNKPKKRKMNEF